MEYNGYTIEEDKTGYAPKHLRFHFFENDEYAVGAGESVEDCKKQINEIIFERVHLDNFKKWKSNNGWSFIHPLKIYQHKNKEIYKTDQELYEMYVEQYTE